MLDTTTKAYNIDKKIDYFTVRSMAIRSLEKIVREELNRHIASINLHKIIDGIQEDDDEDIMIANTNNNLVDYQHDNTTISIAIKTENKKYNSIPELAYCNLKA
jgi:hypothetical protein